MSSTTRFQIVCIKSLKWNKPNITRTVGNSDYTPALVLPKHIAVIFDEKCREKDKGSNKQEKAGSQSGQTEEWTDVNSIPSTFSKRGFKYPTPILCKQDGQRDQQNQIHV